MGVDQLHDDIEYALEHPAEFDLEYQDDAAHYADFLVDIPIQSGVDRPTVVRTLKAVLEDKDLRLTRHTASVLQGFCDSTHDIAKAIHYLPPEDGWKIRLDGVKYALQHLPSTRIVPSTSGTTKSKVLHTLLAARRPLSQTELCNRADVSTQSFRNHHEELVAFDLIRLW